MRPSGIEPATFRFVAQHLNHCATAVPVVFVGTQLIFHVGTGYVPQDTEGSCGATTVLRGSRADLNTYLWFLTSMMTWKMKSKSGKTRL